MPYQDESKSCVIKFFSHNITGLAKWHDQKESNIWINFAQR